MNNNKKNHSFPALLDLLVSRFWGIFVILIGMIGLYFKAMYDMEDFPYFARNSVLDIVLIAIFFAIYFLVFKYAKKIEHFLSYPLLWVTLGTFALLYIFLVPLIPFSDTKPVTEGALAISHMDVESLFASDYLQTIVKNMKVSFFYGLLDLIFPKSIIGLRMINCLFYLLSCHFAGKLADNIGIRYPKTIMAFSGTILPFFLYCNQIYFDLPVVCLCTIALYFYTHKDIHLPVRMLCTGLFLGLACCLRILAIIIMIAIGIDFIFRYILPTIRSRHNAAGNHLPACICAFLLMLVLCIALPKGANSIINANFRSPDATDESIWTLFCMGINEEEFGMMHNELLAEGSKSFDDFTTMLFSRSLEQNTHLFPRKIVWTWTQGTYQVQRYAFGGNKPAEDKFLYQTFLTYHLQTSDQPLRRIIDKIGRCQYMALFLWMGIGALMLNKKERDRLRPFIYTLFGTFLILILYEMKARYVLHCLLPMILLAWKGMECTSQKLPVPGVETINIRHNHAEDSILPRLRQCIILLVLAGALCIFTYQTRWQQTYTTSVSAAHDLDLSDVTIDLGLSDNKKYQFMFTADYQMISDNATDLGTYGNDAASRRQLFQNQLGQDSKETLAAMIDYANNSQVDAFLTGGDVIDELEPDVLGYAQAQLSRLSMPYLLTMGNHDSADPWEDTYHPDSSLLTPWFPQGTECQSLEYDDVIICSVNNGIVSGSTGSESNISATALAQFKDVLAKGKPVILIVHVPLRTNYNEDLYQDILITRGVNKLMGENCGYELTAETKEFLDLVTASDSPVKCVLAGHIHKSASCMITPTIPEYVVGPAYKGEGIMVSVE